MKPSDSTVERIQTALDGLDFEFEPSRDGIACVAVQRDAVRAVLARLRDDAAFEALTLITAVDLLDAPRATARFEVLHQLHSIEHADRVRLRTRLDEDDATIPTCTDLWLGAGFMERECWDMFGIVFEGNPNLKRLLMPDGYGHHPLRKDFPHQGIEPDRLYREWDRERRKKWNAEEAKR